MYSEQLEAIIDAALADGVLTDKEREVLHKRAAQEGIDADELDVVIDGRLAKVKKQEDWLKPAPPQNLENEKKGNIVKCPNCGCTDVAGRAVCPECGHAFSNVKANSSSVLLAKKLEEIDLAYRNKSSWSNKKESEKFTLIQNFPIPNSRDDLLEFLSSLSAKKSGPTHTYEENRLKSAYKQKFNECLMKARINFANDPAFQYFFEKKEFKDKLMDKLRNILKL